LRRCEPGNRRIGASVDVRKLSHVARYETCADLSIEGMHEVAHPSREGGVDGLRHVARRSPPQLPCGWANGAPSRTRLSHGCRDPCACEVVRCLR
jgi:hypothetical protein